MLRLFKFVLIIFFSVCVYAQTDPNTDPNWDWINGDYPNAPYPSSQYRMYIANNNGVIFPAPIGAPWGQGNAWIGLQDMKREDGWELVSRDFGTPYRYIWAPYQEGAPYFILYNRFKGILRFFIMIKSNQDLTSGALEIKFHSDNTFKTATLTHLKPRAYATDKLINVQNNAGLALSQNMNDNWAWADFPMAYDPTFTATENGAWLDFQAIGTIESAIKIAGTGTGINGNQKEVRDFMTGTNNGAVTLTTEAPAVNSTKIFDQFNTSVFGTASSWDKWKQTITDFNKKLPNYEDPNPISVVNNKLKLFLNNIENNWLFKGIPFIGAAVGLVDFLTGGGQKTEQTIKPTFTGMNISLTGSITTSLKLPNPRRIQVPSSKLNPNVAVFGSYTPIVYNSNIGVLNLTSTPVLKYKFYWQPYGDGHARQYADFQLQDKLNISVNPANGLTIDSIMAYIVMDPSKNVNLQNPTASKDLNLLATWTFGANPKLALESSLDGKFIFRSKMVPYDACKYLRVQGPVGGFTPDITIKIKAVLHRTDDPTAQPVLMVLTYEPELVADGTGNYPEPFYVRVTREFEFDQPEIQPVQYGFLGQGTNTISTPEIIGDYKFTAWSDGNTSPVRQFDATFDGFALYKKPNLSTNNDAYSGNRQLFLTTDDWTRHNLYSSTNRIWYEHRALNGNLLQLRLISDASKNLPGKNPSMDYISFYDGAHNNYIYIVYQQKTFDGKYKIVFKKLDRNGQLIISEDLFTSTINYEDFDAKPYISVTRCTFPYGVENFRVLVVWRQPAEQELQEGLYRYGGIDKGTYMDWYWQPEKFTYSAYLPDNPNIDVKKSYENEFPVYHVVYDDNNKIKYEKHAFTWSGIAGGGISSLSIEEPSINSGYSKNYQPIIKIRKYLSQDRVYVTWLGFRNQVSDAKNTNKVNFDAVGENRVLMRWKMSTSWSSVQVFGNNTKDFSINKGLALISQIEVMGLAWSESIGSKFSNKLIKSPSSGNIITLDTFGKNIQVSNGVDVVDFSGMCLNSFQSQSLPYSFDLSQDFNSVSKESAIMVYNGREGVVGRNDGQFYFALGDITVNGTNINFPQIPDSIIISTLAELNQYLTSESFTVDNNSSLVYGVQYGITDTLYCISALEDEREINFKVELFDPMSNDILGVFDNVTFNENNVIQYENIGYQVDLTGIGNRTLKLRLVADYSPDFSFNLSDRYADESILAKNNLRTINYRGSLAVTEYALEQNYPNPFNPSTTIRYQIPQDGMVTLKVYDILGSEVAALVNEQKSAGRYEVNFDASRFASGVYIYKITSGSYVSSKKMLLVK